MKRAKKRKLRGSKNRGASALDGLYNRPLPERAGAGNVFLQLPQGQITKAIIVLLLRGSKQIIDQGQGIDGAGANHLIDDVRGDSVRLHGEGRATGLSAAGGCSARLA